MPRLLQRLEEHKVAEPVVVVGGARVFVTPRKVHVRWES